MSAYIIFNYKITDRNKIDELTEKIKPVDKKYAAEVIVGSPVKTIEGSTLPNIVIYRFMTFQAAQNWYYSAEQQEISLFRKAITDGWVSIIPGMDETQEREESGYFENS